MPFVALTAAVAAAVLSYGSTVSFIVAIVNGVLSYYAINTILNLRGQVETGTTDDSFDTYKCPGRLRSSRSPGSWRSS